jgi:hypothetical protein
MKKALITMAALATSTSVMAGPSWTYVDLGIQFADTEIVTGEDTIGYVLGGSFGFGSLWHIAADITQTEVNGGKGKDFGFDDTSYELRGGIHPAVTDNTDFVLDIGYTGQEWEFDGADKIKPTNFDIRTGVRSNVGNLELRAFVALVQSDLDSDVDDFDGKGRDFTFTVGGQYNFSDAWSVGVDHLVGGGQDFIETELVGVGPDIASIPFNIGGDMTNVYVRWSF